MKHFDCVKDSDTTGGSINHGLWYNLPLINNSILRELYLCRMELFNRGNYGCTCMDFKGDVCFIFISYSTIYLSEMTSKLQ